MKQTSHCRFFQPKSLNNHRPMKTHKFGFTLVEVMIVVAIVGLLAGIAVPNFIKQRRISQTKACVNNLRVIDHAVQQWALETKKTGTDVVPSPLTDATSELQKYLKAAWSVCPTNERPYLGGFQVQGGPSCPNYGSSSEFSAHILPPER